MDNRQIIARGRTAEVYEWDNSTILKLFYYWVPHESIEREMDAARLASSAQVTCPKFFGSLTVANRTGLIFERIHGVLMLADMTSRPWRTVSQASTFARLHSCIHSKPGYGLPTLKSRTGEAITRAKDLSPAVRGFALQILSSLPDGDSLCHGDFHPGQVMMAQDGPMILDWMNAARGDPAADVARTSVMLSFIPLPPQLSFPVRILRGVFFRRYLNEYVRLSRNNSDMARVRRWMIPISAARLYEEIPGDAKTILPFLARAMEQENAGCH